MKAVVDFIKSFSKKMMVAVGTIAAVPTLDLPTDSYAVSIVYIIVQGVIDIFKATFQEVKKDE
jgi:hypothetical protein